MNRETKNNIAILLVAITIIWAGAVWLAGMMSDDIAEKENIVVTVIGINFDNREAHANWWKTLPYNIVLTCGCSHEWQGIQNVPYENVTCCHGNYFVRVPEQVDK